MATILTGAQQRYLRWMGGLALYVLANAGYLFFAHAEEGLTLFYQLMLITHIVGGVVLSVLATVFVFWHLRRVRNLIRVRSAASGVTLTVFIYMLFASGLFIIYESNSREHAWIFLSHQILALAAPLGYFAHRLVGHFPPTRRAAVRVAAVFSLFGVLLLAGHLATHHTPAPPPPAPAPPADPFVPFEAANFPSEDSPFFPASTTTTSGDFLAARLITRDERGDTEAIRAEVEQYGFAAETAIGAETCRRCHPDTVAQWESSAHRFASFNNPFYRAAVEELRETAGRTTSQWCAGCHDPAIMLAGNMTKEIQPLIPESQAGLTCLACHAIDEVHGLEGNGNYNVADESPSPYLFDHASTGWQRWVADQMTKAKPTAHKRMFLKPIHREPEFCMACHKVSLDVPLNDYKWLRGQNEYDNWHDSGVALNAARTFYLPGEARDCNDCHMPLEEAPLGDVAADDGKVRSHRFPGVNTALPYLRGDFDMLRRTEEFVKDTMGVDLFAIRREGSGGDPGERIGAIDVAKPELAAGGETVFEVVVRNRDVGHTFPGGTNDSNQAWIDFEVTDEEGRTLFRSGGIREDGTVDPSAHFYRVVMLREDGSVADRRDAQTFHVAAFGRVVGPGTADLARYGVTLPRSLAGRTVTIEAKLQWRKFNRAYTEFVFSRPGIRVPDLPHLREQGREIPWFPITTIADARVTLRVADDPAPVEPVDDPAQWMRFNDHGIANLLQGAFDVAGESFARVAELAPERPDGWRNLARRWILSGTPQRAEELLRRVDEVAPTDPQRPYFWGRFFERVEEYEQAVEAYRASLEVFQGDRDAWRRLGAVLFKLHRYEESLGAYLEVLAIDPEDLEAHKRRLDIYRQLGREAEAAEAQKAFEKYKDDELAEQVAREFLLENEEINHDAQRRHVHR